MKNAVDTARELYAVREQLLEPAKFDELLRGAKDPAEKTFYLGLFNAALQLKQEEVSKNGIF